VAIGPAAACPSATTVMPARGSSGAVVTTGPVPAGPGRRR
jgi:hypothetical protein